MKNTRKDGFTSVFIVMIFSSIMAVMIAFISVSLDRAADSLAVTVTANAGSSVLTECNKELHDQYGVLAIKDDPSHLSNLADYYISESIDGINRFIHLELNAVIVDTGYSSNYHLSEFRKQIAELGKKNLIFRNANLTGLSCFSGANLPSKNIASYSSLNPAEILLYLSRYDLSGDGAFITQYAFSNFTQAEIEYMIFGGTTAAANESSTRNTIFAIRCIVNCVETIEDPVLWLEAIMLAYEETDRIMANDTELNNYLRAMVFIMSKTDTLALRMMDIMQLTIGNGFYFKNYAYSFEITAMYTRGKKHGTVTQKHAWVD